MKKLIKLIILIIPIILISFLKPKAFASTNYNYQVQFDYECYKIENTSSSLISAGNSVSYINIPNNEGDNGELDIVLKGNKNANKNILVKNDYINITEITININIGINNKNFISTSFYSFKALYHLIASLIELIARGIVNLIVNTAIKRVTVSLEINIESKTQPI